jgi:hypothetical protein
MSEDSSKPDHAEARRMLDICASVGARAVDLTLTSSSGEKEWFRRNLALVELGRMLPGMLDEAAAKAQCHHPTAWPRRARTNRQPVLPGVQRAYGIAASRLKVSPRAASASTSSGAVAFRPRQRLQRQWNQAS